MEAERRLSASFQLDNAAIGGLGEGNWVELARGAASWGLHLSYSTRHVAQDFPLGEVYPKLVS